MEKDSIVWQTEEYKHNHKTPDWFWALGIITISIVVASVIKENYIFALFVLTAGIVVGFFGNKKPAILTCEINNHGFTVQNILYPYKKLKAFYIQENIDGKMLHLSSERILLPIISVAVEDEYSEEIRKILKKYLPEKELSESLSHKIMEKIGF